MNMIVALGMSIVSRERYLAQQGVVEQTITSV